MPLTEEQVKEIREALDDSQKPLFFFHDDADGLASFLLLYRYKREGQGIPVKATPNIDEKFMRKVKEFTPDYIFVVDIAMMEQDFIDECGAKVVWIDHHPPQIRKGVKYYNPKMDDPTDETPASSLCYQVTAKEDDKWIATVGTVGDWNYGPVVKEYQKEHPDMIPPEIDTPEKALFTTKIGKLVDLFSFILKGKMSDVYSAMKTMTRINSPEEILNQTTSQGKFLYKKFQKINVHYEALMKNLEENKKADEDILLFIYGDEQVSFTKELSNRMLFEEPKKIIIIGREHNEEVKISLRSADRNILEILENALEGIEGYGGGHEHACGACVKRKDFQTFIENIRSQIRN